MSLRARGLPNAIGTANDYARVDESAVKRFALPRRTAYNLGQMPLSLALAIDMTPSMRSEMPWEVAGVALGFVLLSVGLAAMALFLNDVCAAGNLLLLFGNPRGGLAVVSDPSGATWKVRGIVSASALVSIFTMGAFSLLAWIRLAERNPETATL